MTEVRLSPEALRGLGIDRVDRLDDLDEIEGAAIIGMRPEMKPRGDVYDWLPTRQRSWKKHRRHRSHAVR